MLPTHGTAPHPPSSHRRRGGEMLRHPVAGRHRPEGAAPPGRSGVPHGFGAAPSGTMSIGVAFHEIARTCARVVGSPWAFLTAVAAVVVWAATGPLFGFSDTWQLVVNTATTIVTFLMVFLLQNTQNRDAAAVHLKLDELIRAVRGARNRLVDLEEMTDEELEALREQFRRLKRRAATAGHDAERGG